MKELPFPSIKDRDAAQFYFCITSFDIERFEFEFILRRKLRITDLSTEEKWLFV